MNGEKVSFDSQGGYVIGEKLKEMDVKSTEKGKKEATTPSTPNTSTKTTKIKSSGRKPFNLDSLRQKTTPAGKKPGKDATSTSTKTEKAKEESKQTPPVVKEPAVEKTTKALTDEVVAPSTSPVEEVKEVVEETSTPPAESEIVEEASTAEVESDFSLTQLGLAKETEKVEEPAEHPQQGAIATMELKDEPDKVGEKPSATSIEVAEESTKATEQFEVVSVFELFSEVGIPVESVVKWVPTVLRASVAHPTSVFANVDYSKLKVYSVFIADGRNSGTYITMGVGTKIGVCSFTEKSGSLEDHSDEISISGSCAIVSEMPVASWGQLKNTALVL